jgi:putative ABC transport system ATP-binding protein
MNEIILKAENLVKEYEEGRVKALRGVNFEVKRGEFVAIMGPSGCGKSTLLNMLGALDRPTSGDVIIDGERVSQAKSLDEIRLKKIGFIFQAFYLIPTLTALENVQIPMIEVGLPRKERLKRAMELLKIVGLEERVNQIPSKLSGGERQRVAIARSLANSPSILLADEPTGNLDSKSSEQIITLLKEINKKRGMTIVLVTHDQNVASYADRIVKMKDGIIYT